MYRSYFTMSSPNLRAPLCTTAASMAVNESSPFPPSHFHPVLATTEGNATGTKFPYHQDVSWTPSSIVIPSSPGLPPIEIMSCFTYDRDDPWAKRNLRQIVLPPDVYPPSWDERTALEQVIIDAALRPSGTELTRARTTKDKFGGGRRCWLECRHGSSYNGSTLTEDDEDSKPTSHYKEGVKKDNIVNKNATKRGSTKNAGKKMKRRCTTSKPDTDATCPFRITLKLLPGDHWEIIGQFTDCATHNHIHLHRSEMRHSTSHMTPAEKDLAATVLTNAHGGSAQNILSDVTGKTFSQQQLYYVKHKLDFGHPPVPVSDSVLLMEHLQAGAAEGHLRYAAIFHEVTDSTLVAIDKATKRKQPASLNTLNQHLQAEDWSVAEALSIDVQVRNCTVDARIPFSLDQTEDLLELGVFLSPMLAGLRVGQKVLLAVAWARVDEAQLFEQFPEVLMFDVTMGTNNEGRPLGISLSIDGNMEVFTPFRVFLPAQTKFAFDWTLSYAIATIMGEHNLRRIRLFLTDGDPKIYDRFDAHQSRLYPNAIHALCMYHLVTKGVEKLGNQIQGKDMPVVKAQLHHFKHVLYSWMKEGGIESEAEFQVSLRVLTQWLHGHKQSKVNAVASNAAVLETFLLRTILYHKKRWFFPDRAHHLTLAQKTTSALEGMNHTIKCKSSKTVTPNMSMLLSLQTQDNQAQKRMMMYKRRVMVEYSNSPTWADTGTANHVSKVCESQIQKNKEQRPHYNVRKVDGYTLEMVRKEVYGPKYCNACSLGKICESCDENSPVVHFRRKRTVSFEELKGGGQYVVRCSCLYHGTYGIPCRHVCRVLEEVLPEHVNVRWWLNYAALYKREGFEKTMEQFRRAQHDSTLVVTKKERDQMFQEAERTLVDPAVFDIPPFCAFQYTSVSGYVDITEIAHDVEATATVKSLYSLLAGLSQETGLGIETEVGMEEHRLVVTNNSYVNMVAHLEMITNRVKHDTELSREFQRDFSALIAKYGEMIRQRFSKTTDREGEFVSPFPSADVSRKCVRIKSGYEIRKKQYISAGWEQQKKRKRLTLTPKQHLPVPKFRPVRKVLGDKMQAPKQISSLVVAPKQISSVVLPLGRDDAVNIVGLENIGNSCYLNSVLQMIFAMDPTLNTSSPGRTNLGEGNTCEGLLKTLFQQKLRSSRWTGAPSITASLRRALSFSENQQEDASEAMILLLEKAPNYFKEVGVEERLSFFCRQCKFTRQVDAPRRATGIVVAVQEEPSAPRRATGIVVAVQEEPSADVQEYVLADLVKTYMTPENLPDHRCERCQSIGTTFMPVVFSETRQHVLITLKRFEYNIDKNQDEKVDCIVHGCLQVQLGTWFFELVGAIVHDGPTPRGGHYYALRRHADEEWYKVNDNTVEREPTYETLVREGAYVLLFAKTKQSTVPLTPEKHGSAPTAFERQQLLNDLWRLGGKNWLNDVILSNYLGLLQDHADRRCNGQRRIFFFHSLFYTRLAIDEGSYSHHRVKNWTTRQEIDVFELSLLVFPVHVSNDHWCLGVLDVVNRQVVYYDSLGGRNPHFFRTARRYLVDEHRDKKNGSELSLMDWRDVYAPGIPRQNNGYDCGVFALEYARCIALGVDMVFTQHETPLIRQRLNNELRSDTLLFPVVHS